MALDQNGNGVGQAIIGTANGVVAGDAVMECTEAGIDQIRVHLIDHLNGQIGNSSIIIQAGSTGDLEVVQLELLTVTLVVAHLGEEELMVINDDMGHEGIVHVMQHGVLLSGDDHVVTVHIGAAVIAAPEQEAAFHVHAGNHHDVDRIQDLFAVLTAELLDHNQSALTGGGLIRMDLGLLPHDGQTAVLQDLSSLFHGSVSRDLLLGEDQNRQIIVQIGGGACAVNVHVRIIRILSDEVHHLVLRSGLIHSTAFPEGGSGERLVALQLLGAQQVLHLVGTLNGDEVLDALIKAFGSSLTIHTNGVVGAGLKTGTGAGAGLNGKCLGASSNILFIHDKELDDVVILALFNTADIVAIATGLVRNIFTIRIGFNLFQCAGQSLRNFVKIAGAVLQIPGGNSLVDVDQNIILGDILRILKNQFNSRRDSVSRWGFHSVGNRCQCTHEHGNDHEHTQHFL